MIVNAKIQLSIPCSNCTDGSFRVDQLLILQTATWTCIKCHKSTNIKRISENDFETIPAAERINTPITVVLKSTTTPPIFLKLNTWRYSFSQGMSKEEFEDNERYFYNDHTCPINFMNKIVEIEFQGDNDPHGLFEFVSVEDGHYENPN